MVAKRVSIEISKLLINTSVLVSKVFEMKSKMSYYYKKDFYGFPVNTG